MDLGCVDMGCIEKQSNEISPQKESNSSSSSSDSVMATSKIGKNKPIKESGQSNWNAFSKCSSQIRKPPRRKTSPLNWFPRKKVDSYLMRKIKSLQEVDGMNSTLDETLGDSNLHYSKVLKEKIAVKEAATKAMEARKAAMVEASWCRILKAASIECKDAEAQLVDAENVAAEAFEAATSIGVTMYDIPDCPQRHCKIESSAVKGGGSATHTVSASFETAFEVDKQVANALKTALTNLANCSSIKKEDFRELLRKISQNPDSDENSRDFSEISSECESDTGSEFEMALHGDGWGSQSCTNEKESSGVRERKNKKRQVSEKFNMANLAEMMLERLKSLQEDQLASLAIVVATCGLNAALAEAESSKKHDLSCTTNNQLHIPAPRRMSFSEVRNFGMDQQKIKAETELPSLDKFLVKKLTRLEREVLEAKNARKNEVRECNKQQLAESTKKSGAMVNEESNSLDESVSEFGNGLVKHSSKLEKEIEDARKNGMFSTTRSNKLDRMRNLGGSCVNQDVAELPSLDKFLVKHVSKLEKEVQEAKNRRNFKPLDDGRKFSDSRKATCFTPEASTEKCSSFAERESPVGKENVKLNKNIELDFDPNKRKPSLKTAEELSHENDGSIDAGNCHDKVLVNADHVCQGDAMQESSLRSHSNTRNEHMRNGGSGNTDCESLDKILVKHVSRLEREKMEFCAREGAVTSVRRETKKELDKGGAEESLDQVLVKHKSRLEREKMSAAAAAAAAPLEDQVMHSVARRAARQKELQEAWGGLSLGNSMRPHLSRLQRDKAAWVKAEEEERKRAQ